jgi:hypothetical protein
METVDIPLSRPLARRVLRLAALGLCAAPDILSPPRIHTPPERDVYRPQSLEHPRCVARLTKDCL